MSVPLWGYMDGYTAAQIELLVADAPIVVYDKQKTGDDKTPKKPSELSLKQAILKYQEKQESGGGGLSLDDYNQ